MAPPRRRRGRVVTPARRAVLQLVAARVPHGGRPVLVAVDGGDASGKTVLADELAGELAAEGTRRPVRASLDDFHHPRAHRHALGRTGLTVWERGFDYAAVRRELLDPWRRGRGTAYRTRWHDLSTDRHVDAPPHRVPEGGVLVVDGVFAQRPELAASWDLVVYLHVPDEVRVARMAARDGLVADPRDPGQRRYLEAQRIYHETCAPMASADLVVDNTDPDCPVVLPGERVERDPTRSPGSATDVEPWSGGDR